MTRSITILGATGSIGRSTSGVIQAHREEFRVEAVVGGRNATALAKIAQDLGAKFAALADEGAGEALSLALSGSGIRGGAGHAAVLEAVDRDADIVLAAISGTAGLAPTHAALKPGRRIALANKESLVCAGGVFMADARRLGVQVMPVDSEHNALDHALAAGSDRDVEKAVITASGGPFRTWTKERIARADAREASAHPVWSMGSKINIDSSTLMNKGLELIEAHHLFDLEPERLDVLVHPEAIVHGLVQWSDGAVTAGLALPDMKVPIANALRNQNRLKMDLPRLDLAAIGRLSFEQPDEGRFPCLSLAKAALRTGGAMPTILNAANEIAVEAFIADAIGFYDISELVERVCSTFFGRNIAAPSTVADALRIDQEARQAARQLLPTLTGTARL
ncbi:1-deoxy-D-xylulose-5-phosphate reductoisomerase [Microvirga terrae]|uniref:1-deoxy-D-xylulose 5-phosphate reductoisomerase n=1 Tax=Microvirga terrae TaxID=2740529 RepID=A0ABY5RM59_9HYPH|nr:MULTISPECIES: 1-deoxy-D-xylulose-5-phosphate reductoisomerase [Microvirga]MBQ0822944.1 1-deoxy-D-xylulose-5-phosphate reductoisomerase [Microvirga sp. HBU67558]UVF17434.1 1-deoxy-D-xylulose-5-phosphate reductoisomerase [Microvirga terrae]